MKAESDALPINVNSVTKVQSLPVSKETLIILLALIIGSTVWSIPPPALLNAKAMHFLATMIVAVTLWVLEVFDDYVVGLMLILSWVIFGIVPSEVAARWLFGKLLVLHHRRARYCRRHRQDFIAATACAPITALDTDSLPESLYLIPAQCWGTFRTAFTDRQS